MAENFEDVVKKLGSTVKKSTAAKAPAVLAVQMVDSKGKVIKEEKGAAAAEAQREEEKRGKKTNTLLSGILKAIGGGGGRQRDSRGRFTKGGLLKTLGIGAAGGLLGSVATTIAGGAGKGISGLMKGATKAFSSPAMAKIMGPAAIAAGIAMMVSDGMEGMKKAKEWDVSKTSAALGGAIGGTKSGWEGAMANAGKWAVLGAGAGFLIGGPLGAAAGGVLGGAIGAVMGFIGGKKIAEFFDGVGKWASEKWEIIKAFPGKIWTAIVDTVKGWIGLTPEGEVPVTVEEDKPKKGWLASLISFLIPQWLVDFAKDALGTVMGWLGLTEKDDQGKVTTTAFGKLVFGTIGQLADFAMSIIKFLIPQFIVDFVASPLTTVMGWLGLTTKDDAGEVKPTEFGKKVFGTVTKITNWIGSVIKTVIGEKTYNAIVKFATDPLDYVLVDLLGWKTAEGKATEEGKIAVKEMEKGFGSFATLIIKKIIGAGTYDAIVAFAKDPFDYILVNWLGWKTAGGEKTATGVEVQEKLDKGNITGIFGMVLDAILPKSLREFVKDPIDYIFVNWLKLKSKNDVDTVTTAEKAGVIAGTAVGLWAKLLRSFLPDGVVDFIMSPINWVFGLFGWKTPAEALAQVEEAHGLEVAEKGAFSGLFGKILSAIIPAGLLTFLKNPIDYILKEFLGIDLSKPPEDVVTAPGDQGAGEAKRIELRKELAKKAMDMIGDIPGLGWLAKKAIGPEQIEGIFKAIGFAKGGPFQAGQPMIVGEMGPEMILPDQGGQVLNAQRTQQMLQAGMQRGMGGGAGGGITSINTGGNVVSSPTTNYVNNGIAARRPIILAA